MHHDFDSHLYILWKKVVPLKVSLLAWRTINKRIPTKDNLICHGVVPSGSLLCLGGCGKEEIVNNVFLNCNFFGSICASIMQWLGISCVQPVDGCLHTLQFDGTHFQRKDIGHSLLVIWLASKMNL